MMDDYSELSTPSLHEELEMAQWNLGVLTMNLRHNSVYTPAEAERYSKGFIGRLKIDSDRVVRIIEVLRERKQPVQFARFEHWHPIIQAVLIAKFRKSKEPLLQELVRGVKPVIPKNPRGPAGRRFRL